MATVLLQPLATQGNAIQDEDGNTIFVFDATLNEEHTFTAEVTRFPVGRRASTTDHIQQQPNTYSTTGIVTNTPVDPASIVRQNVGLEEQNRIAGLLEALVEAKESGAVFTVVTSTFVHQNMAIERVRAQRSNSPPKQDMELTVEFGEITFAEAQAVLVPDELKPRAGKGKQKEKKVKDGTTEDKKARPAELRGSLLRGGLQTFADFTTAL